MGKSKLYTEPESYNNAPKETRTTVSVRNRIRRSAAMPNLRHSSPLHTDNSLPFGVLIRLIWMRLKRNWVALRYQANRYGIGAVSSSPVIKIAGVIAATYFIFFYNGTPATVNPDGSGRAMGVSLNFFEGRHQPSAPRKAKTAMPANEAAPVSANQLTEAMATEYINRFHEIAQKEMKVYGIPASISLAQGLIESRAGDSKLARNNNNHFGIKCFSRSCKRGHCSNFTDDTHKDFFRKFNSPWESWRAHSLMLSQGRYHKLKKYGRDYRQWAYGLKSVGYATDRTYAEKLIGTIERYNLHKFDN